MRIGALMGVTVAGLMLALAGSPAEAQQQDTPPSQQQNAPAGSQDDGTGTTEAPAKAETSAKWYHGMRAGDLVGEDVSNQTDETVGEIEKIVADSDNETYAVVSVGGFLGIGAKEVMIPLTALTMRNDQVQLLSTQDEGALEGMADYDESRNDYRELAEDEAMGD